MPGMRLRSKIPTGSLSPRKETKGINYLGSERVIAQRVGEKLILELELIPAPESDSDILESLFFWEQEPF